MNSYSTLARQYDEQLYDLLTIERHFKSLSWYERKQKKYNKSLIKETKRILNSLLVDMENEAGFRHISYTEQRDAHSRNLYARLLREDFGVEAWDAIYKRAI